MCGLDFTDTVSLDGEEGNYPNRNIRMVVLDGNFQSNYLSDILRVAYGMRKTPREFEVFSTRNSTWELDSN
jgi:hypothetical protein